jgi:hypothetical protein
MAQKLAVQKGNIMIKRIIKILFVSLLAVVFIGSSAIAQGKGKGQSGNRPAGWDNGQKEGWQSEVPPGQEEKEKKRKNISGEEEDLEDKQIEKEKKEKQERKQHRKRKQNKKKNQKNN